MIKKRIRLAAALLLLAVATGTVYAAATAARIQTTAEKCRDLCTRVAELQADLLQFGVYNGNQAVDWNGMEANDPGIDAAGLVDGQDYTPQEVSNAIGGLADIATAINTRMENLNKLISPESL